MKKHNSVLQCQTKVFVLFFNKIQALLKAERPQTTKLLLSFLCSNDYYRNDYRPLWHVQWGENRSYWSYKLEFWYFKKSSLYFFHLVYGRKIIYLLWYPLHSGSPKFVGSFYVKGRMLNVMTTTRGLYGWNCLNMGISTASEIFRRNLESVLNGIPSRIRRRQTKQKTSMKPQSNSV